MTTILSRMPRGPGILLNGRQHMPASRVGHITWGAAYLGSSIMAEQIEELRAAGAREIYVWAHPGAWVAATFETSVARAERACAQYGLAGYIADPEYTVTQSQAVYYGSLLKASADRGLSVGLTSFAVYPYLADFARGCDGAVWGMCQIYNRGSDLARDFDRWFARFRTLFTHAIILVATFVPATVTGRQLETAEGYEVYLSKLPSSAGWASFGAGGPSFMQARLASWRPAGPITSAMFALGLPAVAHMPVFYSVILVALIALGLTLYFFFRRRK